MIDHTQFNSYGEYTNHCVMRHITTTRAQRTAAMHHFFRVRSRL